MLSSPTLVNGFETNLTYLNLTYSMFRIYLPSSTDLKLETNLTYLNYFTESIWRGASGSTPVLTYNNPSDVYYNRANFR